MDYINRSEIIKKEVKMTNSAFNLLLAASVAGLAGTAAAETKGIILDNADNSQVAVSIYNNDLAFVRDSRTA